MACFRLVNIKYTVLPAFVAENDFYLIHHLWESIKKKLNAPTRLQFLYGNSIKKQEPRYE